MAGARGAAAWPECPYISTRPMRPPGATIGTEGDAGAMATRFTRVTVVADGRELDVSLPAARPIGEVLPQLCALLSVAPPGAWGSWSLSNVSGAIDSRGSLDDAGVVDADVLYLTMPEETPAPPFVEDVAEEIRTKLDADGSEWSGRSRRVGASAVAATAVIGLVPVVLRLPLVPAGRLGALAGVGLGVTLLAWLLRGHGGAFLLGAALPAWVLAGVVALPPRLAGAPMDLVAGVTGAGVGLLAFAVLGARWRRSPPPAGCWPRSAGWRRRWAFSAYGRSCSRLLSWSRHCSSWAWHHNSRWGGPGLLA